MTVPLMSEVNDANHSWKMGIPDKGVKVNVTEVIAAVGRNQPDAPLVSATLPAKVAVPGFHVGWSVNGPPVQLDGTGVEAQ